MIALPETDAQDALRARLGLADGRAYVWPRHVPYFQCAHGRWLEHGGYVRLVEEAVERFLAFVGLPIGALLRDRRWIPVVQDVQLTVAEPVEMEELLFTVVRLVDLHVSTVWELAIDFYVLRDEAPVRTASARIKHAYALVDEREEWRSRVVRLDPATADVLRRWLSPADEGPEAVQ
jgi:acyl-CoA thioesterase FadM